MNSLVTSSCASVFALSRVASLGDFGEDNPFAILCASFVDLAESIVDTCRASSLEVAAHADSHPLPGHSSSSLFAFPRLPSLSCFVDENPFSVLCVSLLDLESIEDTCHTSSGEVTAQPELNSQPEPISPSDHVPLIAGFMTDKLVMMEYHGLYPARCWTKLPFLSKWQAYADGIDLAISASGARRLPSSVSVSSLPAGDILKPSGLSRSRSCHFENRHKWMDICPIHFNKESAKDFRSFTRGTRKAPVTAKPQPEADQAIVVTPSVPDSPDILEEFVIIDATPAPKKPTKLRKLLNKLKKIFK